MRGGRRTLLDYVVVLVKWRRLIIRNFLLVCFVMAIISLLLTKWYTAKTAIMPPEEQGTGLSLPAGLSDLPLSSLGLPSLTLPSVMYVAILESRTVSESVITELDLIEVYETDHMEEAVETLQKRIAIDITEEGVVSLTATARSPQLAADIANRFVSELDERNKELNVAQARNKRLFIEERLAKNMTDLRSAEESLREFQEEHKAISLTEQTIAAIEGAAQLIGEMQALEIERDVLLTSMTPTNPAVMKIESTIEAIKKQLHRMDHGDGIDELPADGVSEEMKFYVPLSEVPQVGLRLARRLRELKVQETIFQLLTQQYEQAKIQEAKDTPTVQILDAAVPPMRKSKPQRALLVLTAGILSIIFTLIFIFSTETYQNIKVNRSTDFEKIEAIRKTIRADLCRIPLIGKKLRRSKGDPV